LKRGALWSTPRPRLTTGSSACGPTCHPARRRERVLSRADGGTPMTRAPAAAIRGHGCARTPGGWSGDGPASRLPVRLATPASATIGASVRGDGSAGRSSARMPRIGLCSAGLTGRSAAPLGCATACTSCSWPIGCGPVGRVWRPAPPRAACGALITPTSGHPPRRPAASKGSRAAMALTAGPWRRRRVPNAPLAHDRAGHGCGLGGPQHGRGRGPPLVARAGGALPREGPPRCPLRQRPRTARPPRGERSGAALPSAADLDS
jgi:hypothetical protein